MLQYSTTLCTLNIAQMATTTLETSPPHSPANSNGESEMEVDMSSTGQLNTQLDYYLQSDPELKKESPNLVPLHTSSPNPAQEPDNSLSQVDSEGKSVTNTEPDTPSEKDSPALSPGTVEAAEVEEGFEEVMSKKKKRNLKKKELRQKAREMKESNKDKSGPSVSAITAKRPDWLEWLRDGLGDDMMGGLEDKRYLDSLSRRQREEEMQFRKDCREYFCADYDMRRWQLCNSGYHSKRPSREEIKLQLAQQLPPPLVQLRKAERSCAEPRLINGTLMKIDTDRDIGYISYSQNKRNPEDRVKGVPLREFVDYRIFDKTKSTPKGFQRVKFQMTGDVVSNVKFIDDPVQTVQRSPSYSNTSSNYQSVQERRHFAPVPKHQFATNHQYQPVNQPGQDRREPRAANNHHEKHQNRSSSKNSAARSNQQNPRKPPRSGPQQNASQKQQPWRSGFTPRK